MKVEESCSDGPVRAILSPIGVGLPLSNFSPEDTNRFSFQNVMLEKLKIMDNVQNVNYVYYKYMISYDITSFITCTVGIMFKQYLMH
jgi:hypothetical protein